MRWSRHHADSSLGELLDAQPDAAQPDADQGSATAGSESDEDTTVRLWPGDFTGDPTTIPAVAGSADDAPDPGAGFLDDEDYLPQEHRGPGRLTVALVAALVLTVGVLGGVWVQKQLGTSASAGGGQGAPGGAAGGQGFPGGTAGGQGLPGGAASAEVGGQGMPGGAVSGDAGSSPAAGDASSTATAPVVVGTVSSSGPKSLVVLDLGGTKHTVTVTSTTTVTTPYGHDGLVTGDTVAVAGTTTSDGSVTATGVTVS